MGQTLATRYLSKGVAAAPIRIEVEHDPECEENNTFQLLMTDKVVQNMWRQRHKNGGEGPVIEKKDSDRLAAYLVKRGVPVYKSKHEEKTCQHRTTTQCRAYMQYGFKLTWLYTEQVEGSDEGGGCESGEEDPSSRGEVKLPARKRTKK